MPDVKLLKGVYYFPVFGSGMQELYKYKKEDMLLRYWDRDDIKGIMVSYWYAKEIQNYKNFLNMKDDKILAIDSGGNEIPSLGVEIDPVDVIQYQLNNGDLGFILDYPPVEPGLKNASEKLMKPCMMKTIDGLEKAIKYLENNNREDFTFYGIVQGSTLEQLDMWWDSVIKPYEKYFHGIAIPPRPSGDPRSIASVLWYLKKKKIKRVHLLGVGGGWYSAIPIYYSKRDFDLITYDSSISIFAYKRAIYRLPFSFKRLRIGYKYLSSNNNKRGYLTIGDKNKPLNILPCDCIYCKRLIEHGELTGIPLESYKGYLIMLHDIDLYLKYVKFIDFLAEYNLLKKYVNSIDHFTNNKLLQAINILDKGRESSVSSILEKYF